MGLRHWVGPLRTLALLVALVGAAALVWLYKRPYQKIALEINGVRLTHTTLKSSAQGVVEEIGYTPVEADHVVLPADEALAAGEPIVMRLARYVRILHDGTVDDVYTHATTLGEALAAAGVTLAPHDGVHLNGHLGDLAEPLPPPVVRGEMTPAAWIAAIRKPIHLQVRRAVPITVYEDGIPLNFYTTGRTVGEALYQKGVRLYVGDRIFPPLDATVAPGIRIYISRAHPVILEADGTKRLLRSHAPSVKDLLTEARITLEGDDYTRPTLDAAIADGMYVQVVRVYDEYYIEERPIPFDTRWEPNPDLEIDQRRTANWGREGAWRQKVRIRYENGQEIHRTEEEAWIAREPEDRVIEYGTKIVIRQLQTEYGTLEYWRKLRMLATSYNAETAGKPLDSPTFGITRLGERARKGIIAVDPTIIPLRQPMYVPGYGLGYAGDTGSAIKNRRIDLCYDSDNLVLWYRWVDVYLLTPVPPLDRITWIVPNIPPERE